MKLVYWVADCYRDSRAYAVRARTRKECKAMLDALDANEGDYGAPRKVTVEYRDAFDLVRIALGEGGIE